MTGLFICLRSATKITHKGLAITGLATKWHVFATINSFDSLDEGETPRSQIDSSQVFPITWDSDDDDGDDDSDSAKFYPIYAHTISFQKRQALGNITNCFCNLYMPLSALFLVLIVESSSSLCVVCSDVSGKQQSRNYNIRIHAG